MGPIGENQEKPRPIEDLIWFASLVISKSVPHIFPTSKKTLEEEFHDSGKKLGTVLEKVVE